MPTLTTSFFGLTLSSMPIISVRLDFNSLLAIFRNEVFRRQFKGYQGKPIPVKTHYFTWHGRPNTLLTYLLRDAIVSVEGAVSNAVFVEALHRGIMTNELLEATKNPFSLRLRKRGTAACVYNGLPELIDSSFQMEISNPALWDRVQVFYREVRNPIFHSFEVASDDPDPVWQCLEFIWEVFQWLNSWHPIARMTEGPITWTPETITRIEEIPSIEDLVIRQIILARTLPDGRHEYVSQVRNHMAVIEIEEVDGVGTGTDEMLNVGMTDAQGNPVKVLMSPHAAMRLLAFLSLIQQHRGWDLPDRL